MIEKERERIIEFLKTLMTETATLLQELENPAKQADTRPAQLKYDQSKAPAPGIILRFPRELQQFLTATEQGNMYAVKSKWVSSKLFAEIAEAARSLGGKWVSAGKESRWEIPKSLV